MSGFSNQTTASRSEIEHALSDRRDALSQVELYRSLAADFAEDASEDASGDAIDELGAYYADNPAAKYADDLASAEAQYERAENRYRFLLGEFDIQQIVLIDELKKQNEHDSQRAIIEARKTTKLSALVIVLSSASLIAACSAAYLAWKDAKDDAVWLASQKEMHLEQMQVTSDLTLSIKEWNLAQMKLIKKIGELSELRSEDVKSAADTANTVEQLGEQVDKLLANTPEITTEE